MARAVSFFSSAICAICAFGLAGPVAFGTSATAFSKIATASSVAPVLRSAEPSTMCPG